MKQYRYLIIGGGMTAAAALKGIREVDAQGSIGLLTADSHRPYARPPLSRLWKGQTTVEKIMSKILTASTCIWTALRRRSTWRPNR